MVKKISFAAVLLISITAFLMSCKVTFVPSYDSTIITDITDGAKSTDALYLAIAQSDAKEYEIYASDYVYLTSQVNSILLKEQARGDKANNIIKIAENLKLLIIKYDKYHKDKGKITAAEAIIFNQYLQAAWKPLLVAELALK